MNTASPFSADATTATQNEPRPKQRALSIKRTYPRTQSILLLLLLLGDLAFAFLGLCLGYLIRFETPLSQIGGTNASYTTSLSIYLPLISGGTVIYIFSLMYLKVYDARILLRPINALSLITKATFFWYITYVFLSLLIKTEPAISRFFATLACITIFCTIGAWRYIFHAMLMRTKIRERITQNIILVGWNHEARQLSEAILSDSRFAYTLIGYIDTSDTVPPEQARITKSLGHISNIEQILVEKPIDILIICDFSLGSSQLLSINSLCEKHYVQFKIVPSFFRTFVTSLHMQTVSGVPVLGVEDLKILRLGNSILKRTTDIIGAIIGLCLSVPIIAILAYFIKRESPGPVFYKQIRTGKNGHNFAMYKLRSMRIDAENNGAQWAIENDPRRTKIGTFMRETNLDELPQFWNVLIGDMSLVGPRPERPELIEKFVENVPHYNPRHAVRPGITGWAQVSGLRGNTSLRERIKYDLFYIENWSLLFDIQIILTTFRAQKNAY